MENAVSHAILSNQIKELETKLEQSEALCKKHRQDTQYLAALIHNLNQYQLGVNYGFFDRAEIQMQASEALNQVFKGDFEQEFLSKPWFHPRDQTQDDQKLLGIKEDPEQPIQSYQMLKRFVNFQGQPFMASIVVSVFFLGGVRHIMSTMKPLNQEAVLPGLEALLQERDAYETEAQHFKHLLIEKTLSPEELKLFCALSPQRNTGDYAQLLDKSDNYIRTLKSRLIQKLKSITVLNEDETHLYQLSQRFNAKDSE